ncbi:GNAT family N-acetyltransferase [Pseudonocardia sp. TRM90224]|uniref:GNAT family N-acetyltransferase n=1 Tax=Pseudonocardia sp. TRM90224 TaxID=2812678 RepID=UPI001E2926D9|nr:GNAT family N-acetyltransferase [Pseudonocardia sp. TRM90224]
MELDGLLGQRVALRHLVGTREGRPLYSDAVGELDVVGDDVTVVTRRGPVRVARAAVVAVRAVPPAVARRAPLAAVSRLEGLCADAWPAIVDEPLGEWRLRSAGGYTGRANSALAIGDPGLPVPAALDAVRAFAERTGTPIRVQVPVGSPWEKAVAAQGWVLDAGHRRGAEVSVQVAALDTLGEREPLDVELPERPDPRWWELVTGGPPTAAERHVLAPETGLVTAFPLLTGPDGTVGGGLRAAVVEDHLHLSAIEVAPAVRRNGIASGLVATAARWGRDRGARWAVLQVALHNTGALALYDRLGFSEHHQYRYLIPLT